MQNNSYSESPTLAINNTLKRLIKEGRRIFKLGFGQSPFPVPPEVVDALKEHAHEKDYLPVQGLLELREAICSHYLTKCDLSFTADQVTVGPGSKELIFLTQLASKATLLLPAPSWVSYAPQAKMLGHDVCWLPTNQVNNWKLEANVLDEQCKKISGPKLMIFNSYNNPVGHDNSALELQAIAEVSTIHDLLIISDEIYSMLTFTKDYKSLVTFYPDKTIISSGLSKWCGAGGWRLGSMVFPEHLSGLRKTVLALGSETYSCASAPVQYAAIVAYQGNEKIDQYLEHSLEILSFISNFVWTELNNLNVHCKPCGGGFYLFPSFDQYKSGFNELGVHTTDELCNYLLEKFGIALLPGTAFGLAEEKLVCRLSFVDFNGKNLLNFLENNGELKANKSFIKKYFHNIFEAMTAFKKCLTLIN